MADGFETICEIEPPTTGDLGIVREQIAVLRRHCDAFLVPDSHLGRATVSSIAVAHEVGYLRGRPIACLNARDRNLLGLRRDLLTAAAYGVEELLFVYGDRPSRGERGTLTVRHMLAEASDLEAPVRAALGAPFRIGVAADPGRALPAWKRDAAFACTQMSFDAAALGRWRRAQTFDGKVYAGVIVLASEKMARRLMDAIPGFDVPSPVLDRLARDPQAGVALAVEEIRRLRDAGDVDGVHVVPARRYRQLADALEDAEL